MKIRTWYTVWAVSDRKVSPAELWRALHPSVGGVIAEPAFTRETWDALRCKVVIEGCHETPSFDMTEHCVFRVEQTGEVLVQIRWGIDPIVVGRKSAEMQTWVDAMDGEPNRESILAHLRQTQQIITISPIPQTVGIAKL